jgi:iron complex transport system ATP-binding protein
VTLAFADLHVRRGSVTALSGVDGTLHEGQVTALVGPNGAGKSSLLAVLAGLLPPDRGTVTLDGVALSRVPAQARARAIGLLPQTRELVWDVSARTLVGLGRLPFRRRPFGGAPDGPADRAAVDAALAAADVAALADRPVTALSGGEQARVLLARALAGQPRWLLADEPLAGLDWPHQIDVLRILRTLASEGRGVVVALHDLTLAARVADQVLLLRDGRLVATGPAETALAPNAVSAAFGIDVRQLHDPDGGPVLLPALPRRL